MSTTETATPRDFHAALAARYARTARSLREWSSAFRVENGGPLDFSLFPFQREIYDAFGDNDLPCVDVRKSAQCGISAAAVSLALYAADVWSADVVYVLPTESFAETFSDTRVRPAIEASPHLRSRITGTDSKGLKRLGQANLYFVGSVAEATALSIPADVLCFDEFDRLDVTHLAKFEQRLAAPTSLKLIRRFSNPSFPETGIDERYLASDQRSWLVCCARCRYEAPLVYASGDDNEHFVDEGVADRVCGRCHRPLAAEAIASGRWVPRHPRIRARGYHVSKLIVPSQDIGELIAERARTDEDAVMAHHNFSLGLPYAPRGGSLSSDMVKACRRQWTCPNSYGGKNWVTAGVDVGKALHVRISEWRSNGIAIPLFLGEICAGDSTRDFAELANLWRRYNVNFGVIDERPEERAAREFMREFPGRCVLARWAGDAQHDDIVMDGEQGLLLARRTWACDRTVDAFSRQVKYLPASLPSSYVKQMTAPHKVVETAKGGQKVPRYVSDGRADHYFFAETYDLLARERMPTPPAGAWGDPPEPLRRSIFR